MTADSSRTTILKELRRALPESAPLPHVPATGPWQTFDNPRKRFAETLTSVGGTFTHVASLRDANAALQEIEEWTAATIRCTFVPGVGDSTLDPETVSDPHELENTDFAVLPGQFGVAENAAIWVTDEGMRHRVLYFIPQHLAIVIPSRWIVNNMHEAYDCLELGQTTFAAFVSGPSKTADIEQSLVIGAHGARSLTVFAVDEL